MLFNRELDFEKALIDLLITNYGWEKEVLEYKTEEELIHNWADILFENNKGIDTLNNEPLTKTEIMQLLAKINELNSPVNLNGFINNKSVCIKRDNPKDTLHYGKEVYLKIYDRNEIAAGHSRYQICRQPKFKAKNNILPDRRGDFMLLINGMPLIHVELKKSGVSIEKACNQIEKYSYERVFTGLFSLIQIFFAMTPEETIYFANPGTGNAFNKDYFFHWADFNNNPVNDWQKIAQYLLSIPMAHQLIGFYTVADTDRNILKVLRSYQFYAANAISKRVAQRNWQIIDQKGGYIWHTTGSGKTLTSFKTAQLIASSNDADKVVFLVDRIELGTQSLEDYRSFAQDNESVQETESTYELISKLKSNSYTDTLIITSIQKMGRVYEESGYNKKDIETISSKRVVFIIDEAHRSTFGDMLIHIKETFKNAIFFGFTGTPIHTENQKKMNTTADIFGEELHRYSIADGIRDKNVLGFDPTKILTYKDIDIRKEIALHKAKAKSEEEALNNKTKRKIYEHFMYNVPMAGYYEDNLYVEGIEDFIPDSQYETKEHTETVVKNIIEYKNLMSRGGKFYGIFATSSILEAINYYRLFKQFAPDYKVTALFDPTIDDMGTGIYKEDALIEILEDYNKRYDKAFTIPTYADFKKDVSKRLAHKKPYINIEHNKEEQLELLIVVNQMLTGFDSKWINTLYLDKFIEQEFLIQAFSRTNRLYGPEKPFGNIKYYRRPHTMERKIEEAFKLYSGDKPFGLFVDKLEQNLEKLNIIFDDINSLFSTAGISNFEKLPAEQSEKARFAKLFKYLTEYLEASLIQGFSWKLLDDKLLFINKENTLKFQMRFNENTYLILALRYKELADNRIQGENIDEVPYNVEAYLTEIKTDTINNDYMNSRFKKYIKALNNNNENAENILNELHKSFATLTQDEQKYADIILCDIQRNAITIDENKTFRDLLTDYMESAQNDRIYNMANNFGLDYHALKHMIQLNLNIENINEFARLDELLKNIDFNKAKQYIEKLKNKQLSNLDIRIETNNILTNFIINGGKE